MDRLRAVMTEILRDAATVLMELERIEPPSEASRCLERVVGRAGWALGVTSVVLPTACTDRETVFTFYCGEMRAD
jgi:hypothetical protein